MQEQQQHATRVGAGGKIEMTGAKDESGNPVEPTADDLARLGVEGYDRYKEWRKEQIQKRADELEEQAEFEGYRRQFLASGGAPADARAAFAEYRRQMAAEDARQAHELARTAMLRDAHGRV